MRAEPVDGTVLLVVRDDTDDLAVVGQQVHGEELDEEVAVVVQRLAIQRVQHRVARSVRDSTGTVRLPALAELLRLATEGPLVDPAFLGTRERHTVVLQLDDGLGRLTRHVVDRVLVPEPV